MKAINGNITGKVQGVGFRYWTIRTAQNYKLGGYAKNLPDGTVEIMAEGDRGLIEEFLKDVKVGPSHSHVTGLVIDWYEQPEGFDGFDVKY